jgi:hypothetical protein
MPPAPTATPERQHTQRARAPPRLHSSTAGTPRQSRRKTRPVSAYSPTPSFFDPFSPATPHNIVCGALRQFSARALFGKLEIHKVFLRFPHVALTKNCSQITLAELCGAAISFILAAPADLVKKNRERIHALPV